MAIKGKIFCTGLSRTGTTSLCRGLEILGLRTIHFPFALFGQPEKFGAPPFKPHLPRFLIRKWRLQRELKALRSHDPLKLLQENDVFADLPIPLYFQELDQMFPGSKFIHTTRPLEDWLESMKWLMERGRFERNWTVGEVADEMHFQTYGSVGFDEESMTDAFHRHEESIHRYFASEPEKLLTLNLAKGELQFSTIAPFLSLNIPEEPFPIANQKG